MCGEGLLRNAQEGKGPSVGEVAPLPGAHQLRD
jgi:hypothetical protein